MRVSAAAASFVIAFLPLLAWAGSWVSGAKEGVAIQGYDAVAYHTQGKDLKGALEYAHSWGGTTWLFSSEANRALFLESPEKYAPQYGGHCALSVANGRNSRGTGDAWTIRNGKLYLNGGKEARIQWLQNTSHNIYWADRKWPEIRSRLEAE